MESDLSRLEPECAPPQPGRQERHRFGTCPALPFGQLRCRDRLADDPPSGSRGGGRAALCRSVAGGPKRHLFYRPPSELSVAPARLGELPAERIVRGNAIRWGD